MCVDDVIYVEIDRLSLEHLSVITKTYWISCAAFDCGPRISTTTESSGSDVGKVEDVCCVYICFVFSRS